MFTDKCKTPSPVVSNKSIRISATPTPPKNKSSEERTSKSLKTPEKMSPRKDNDPLRNIKLDSSLSGFLTKISENPALKHKVRFGVLTSYCHIFFLKHTFNFIFFFARMISNRNLKILKNARRST